MADRRAQINMIRMNINRMKLSLRYWRKALGNAIEAGSHYLGIAGTSVPIGEGKYVEFFAKSIDYEPALKGLKDTIDELSQIISEWEDKLKEI